MVSATPVPRSVNPAHPLRAADGITITPHSSGEADTFRFGLSQFLDEARTLCGIKHGQVPSRRRAGRGHDVLLDQTVQHRSGVRTLQRPVAQ
jgi:hypothetical protein